MNTEKLRVEANVLQFIQPVAIIGAHLRRMTMASPQEDEVQSSGKQMISRVAAVLRALEGRPTGMSLAQIAAAAGLPRSTVQRIVASLEAERFLSVAPGGSGVRLGASLVRLAAAAHRDMLSIARPYIQALGEKLNESAQLAVDSGDGNTIVIDQYVPNQILRIVLPTGFSLPMHSTAHGKAMLATMSDDEIRRTVASHLTKQTDKTVATMKRLLEQVREVRRTGFSIDREEQVEGVCAIGMAIRTGWGETYGIAVPVPTARFHGRDEFLRRHLEESRQAIEARAGGE